MALLRTGAYISMAAALLSLAGILASRNNHTRGLATGTAGLLIALIIISYPGSLLRAVRKSPLHDITTDTAHPPIFGRRLAPHIQPRPPAPYDNPANAAGWQHELYPDIRPLFLQLPPGAAFRLAQDAARNAGWRIVAADPQTGRIEATDTTFWFGAVEDIAVRLTAVSGNTRVDVRSAARADSSDLGSNARRIRQYLRALATAARPLHP